MAIFESWCEVSPIGDLLVRSARRHPDRAALVLPGERVTYAELLDRACSVARSLWSLGVRPRDHVGLLALNGTEFVEAFFAVELVGGVVVPLHARHKAAELGYITRNADLVALLTTSGADDYVDLAAVLRDALPSLGAAVDPVQLELPEAPRLRSAVLLRGETQPGFLGRSDFDGLAEATDPATIDHARLRVCLRDAALILFTSGTTAHPKGCVLSHEAITRGAVERASTRFASAEHDVTWGAGPLFHIGSLAPFIGCLGTGGTYVTDVYFDAGRALDLMDQEGVTAAWPWFPAIIQGLLDHPSFAASRLPRLRRMLLIGPPALQQRVHEALPEVEVIQACGMTETGGIYAVSGPSESREERLRAQGKPAPGIEVRIVDPDSGADLPAGGVGEILVRGYCVMNGYYRDPEKTAAALDAGGWLHTGDLYSLTAGGSLVFNGRLKDMLKVGGENVAALEVEAFLCEHPAVKTAEVVGAPDERLDEVPVAFVELEPGRTLAPEELIAWAGGRIASYKVPRAVHIVQPGGWPMSATKVDKTALRARLTGARADLVER
jgi:acyl-CoA synthetase (AMP-forming)/AMP-acid ligase II